MSSLYSPECLEVVVLSEVPIQHSHPPITSRIGAGSVSPPLVQRLVCAAPPLPLGEGGDELAAEGRDVGDHAAPHRVSRVCERPDPVSGQPLTKL